MSDKDSVKSLKIQSPTKSLKGSDKKLNKKKVNLCPNLCQKVPLNVPAPGPAQVVLHPHKDVFVLKVAKVGLQGDRRSKMELELVTPKWPSRQQPYRTDTRETQCDPDPPPCCCCKGNVSRKKK